MKDVLENKKAYVSPNFKTVELKDEIVRTSEGETKLGWGTNWGDSWDY